MKNTLRLYLTVCFLLFSFTEKQFAQNLVPNHDFSEFSTCPANLGEILFAKPWYTPNGKSTDFIHECSENGFTSIPMNNWGEEYPASGQGYMGIRVWLTPPFIDDIRNYREYLAVEMVDSLIAEEYYRISFKVSVGDSARFTTDDIGLAFNSTRFPNSLVLDDEPALENEQGNIIFTSEGWHKISGQYQARGGERHLAIGNFKDDAHTTLASRGVEEGTESCYFYVDEVIVEPCAPKFPEKILLTTDTLVCPGETLELRAASIPNASYRWDGISADSVYTVSKPGVYQLEVEVDDCIRNDSIEITEAILPIFDLGADTSICPGASVQLVINDPLGEISWNNQSKDSSIIVTESGKYIATATLGTCSYSDSISVYIRPEYMPEPTFDTIVCEGLEVMLKPSVEGSAYNWQDQSKGDSFTASEGGEYWVDIQTVCFLAREYFTLITKDCGCELFIPNVFTPNGDGINEVFKPQFKDGITDLTINIYDRWGRLMFQTNDPSSFWDGVFQNQLAPVGVYYWQIQYECLSQGMENQVMRKGHLSLFR